MIADNSTLQAAALDIARGIAKQEGCTCAARIEIKPAGDGFFAIALVHETGCQNPRVQEVKVAARAVPGPLLPSELREELVRAVAQALANGRCPDPNCVSCAARAAGQNMPGSTERN